MRLIDKGMVFFFTVLAIDTNYLYKFSLNTSSMTLVGKYVLGRVDKSTKSSRDDIFGLGVNLPSSIIHIFSITSFMTSL